MVDPGRGDVVVGKQEVEARWARADPIEERLDGTSRRLLAAGVRGGHVRDERSADALHDAVIDRVLAAEPRVQRRLGHARAARDLEHRAVAEPAAVEDVGGGVEQELVWVEVGPVAPPARLLGHLLILYRRGRSKQRWGNDEDD